MESSRVKILFGILGPEVHGGISQVSPYLESCLRDKVTIKTFIFGRRSNSERVFDKCIGRFADLIRLTIDVHGLLPDIIHHNTSFDRKSIIRDAPLVFILKRAGIPLLLMIHGSHRESFGKMSSIMRSLRDYVLKNCACIGTLSEAEKNDFCDYWPDLKGKVRVLKNIIKPEFYQAVRRERATPKILFVSRFIRKKGVFDLAKAAPKVLAEFPDAEFLFVGSGPAGGEFDSLVEVNGLGGNIRHLEHIDNLAIIEHYKDSWCLVFPTHYPEGMPMVVAEAMAAGCPVVTTRTRFSLSYMEEEKNCIYVAEGDPESIADGIIRLLKDDNLRMSISRNNRVLAERFTADKVVDEFMNIYKSLNE
ncbi:MAG: hypothetical protein A2509_04090 [Candidatus Edwardsbacteria bacterium RIFOXYD12_FULL_50_11]|nr:MAG: hypothetical protein A2509_04090 [Candidatus Edwardsbacteria bacterium RIFOXYD12_FULL_50_11]